MLLVLVRIGPACLHVCSRLATLPCSVDGTVSRRLHILPAVTVWLSCPRSGCLVKSPKFTHARIHHYKHYYKHVKIVMKMHMNLTHLLNLLARFGWTPLAPNNSVKNSTYHISFGSGIYSAHCYKSNILVLKLPKSF